MQESQNVKIVQAAYAAFVRGDIAGVLATLADDVEWVPEYGVGPHVPTAGRRQGKASVGEFFNLVGQHLRFSRFEPRQYIATGDAVVALGDYAATTSAGRTIDAEFAMVFTVRGGRITHFKEFCDSAAINAAFVPVAAAV